MALNSDIGLNSDTNLNSDIGVDTDVNVTTPAGQAAVLTPSTPLEAEPTAPDPLPPALVPDTEDYDQILQELRQAKTERAVTERRNRKLTLDKVTFGITGAIAVAFVIWGFLGRDSLAATSTGVLDWVMEYTGWLFMVLASLFVVFVLWLALGKFGNIPLGKDGEKPEFRTVSWVAMMFAAGMGIGLMFYGVAEPLYHYISPPPGTVDGRTPAAIQTAMATSIFHWTLHPWAMYAVVGIAMAYGTYRLGRKQLISAAFTSLFGIRMVEGPVGKFINILAIFATLFGTAASLGLGALQIGSGMTSNGWVGEIGTPVLVVIVAILTACFVASAVSGISRGIQWLSNINMVLAVVLALIVFVAGPTLFILNLIPAAVGDYARDLAEMSSRTEAVGDEALRSWMSSWTIFYWAWWVSWTPFVGMFIARISRGRTIRQFVTGVLLVPSIVSVIWFGIFGGAAFHIQQEADKAGHRRWPGHHGQRRTLHRLRRCTVRPGQEPAHARLAHRGRHRPGHGPGGDLLHHRRRLGLHHHGIAELQRRRATPPRSGDLLGLPHRRRGSRHAAGRRRRTIRGACRPATHHHRRSPALRARHAAAVLCPGQGPAPGSAVPAAAAGHIRRRTRHPHRRGTARRRPVRPRDQA